MQVLACYQMKRFYCTMNGTCGYILWLHVQPNVMRELDLRSLWPPISYSFQLGLIFLCKIERALKYLAQRNPPTKPRQTLQMQEQSPSLTMLYAALDVVSSVGVMESSNVYVEDDSREHKMRLGVMNRIWSLHRFDPSLSVEWIALSCQCVDVFCRSSGTVWFREIVFRSHLVCLWLT